MTGEIVEYPCLHLDDVWFSREICEVCNGMHYYCTECGQMLDDCIDNELELPSREDVFGLINGPLTTEEKIGKLLAMIPVAFQIVDEARETIARLRRELEEK